MTRALQLRAWAVVIGVGVAAFALLALRFSPNWRGYWHAYQEAKALATTADQSLAVDKAFLRGYSERGFYVVQQARDLSSEIDTPVHKVVRWRLLFPAIAHIFHWPLWATLGAAQVGAFVLVLVWAALGYDATGRKPAVIEAFAVAVIAGAAAPFFTSMGWLGYYDSWLAIALLIVGLASRRWLVMAACVLAPWIDERFVMGLPLALFVRWSRSDANNAPIAQWIRREAIVPLLLAAAYAVVRLRLSGTSGTHTVAEYFKIFMHRFDISFLQRCRGAWEGGRFGWIFVGAAIAYGWTEESIRSRWLWRALLSSAVIGTAVGGILTALDMSRSMVLLVPAVALGIIAIRHAPWWRPTCVPLLVAGAALVMPAYQAVGITLVPIENFRSPHLVALAQNHLGLTYAAGRGVKKDAVTAAFWLRKAATLGYSAAQGNLATLYYAGDGIPKDFGLAYEWFRRAAAQGSIKAQNNLGVMYTEGAGVPKDWVSAYSWFKMAAERGEAHAADNMRNLKPYLTQEQLAAAEKLIREFVAENPHAQDPTDDEARSVDR